MSESWKTVPTSTETEDHAVAKAFVDRAADFLHDQYLPKIERCLEKLSDEQIWWRGNEESNSIGNLILHLCGNARQWIISGVGSQPDRRVRDAEFAQREVISRDELLVLLRSTLTEIDHVLRTLDPALLLERRHIQGHDVDILNAIFHVTEHFSMHTGQIIMLTKMLTSSDLKFYGFEDGAPVERWRSRLSDLL
ncbi:MAG TPA: DUF1572 family protein [Pyrinomonadaceae bacterium]|nr:DUF1572 family protein [Pyrinomonadaceae bacterium]